MPNLVILQIFATKHIIKFFVTNLCWTSKVSHKNSIRLGPQNFARKHTLQKVCTKIMSNFVGPQKFVAKHKLFQKYSPKHTPYKKLCQILIGPKFHHFLWQPHTYNKFAKPCQDIIKLHFKILLQNTHISWLQNKVSPPFFMNHKIVLLDFVKTSKPQNTHNPHTKLLQNKAFRIYMLKWNVYFFEKRKKNMEIYFVFVLLEKKKRKGKWKEKT